MSLFTKPPHEMNEYEEGKNETRLRQKVIRYLVYFMAALLALHFYFQYQAENISNHVNSLTQEIENIQQEQKLILDTEEQTEQTLVNFHQSYISLMNQLVHTHFIKTCVLEIAGTENQWQIKGTTYALDDLYSLLQQWQQQKDALTFNLSLLQPANAGEWNFILSHLERNAVSNHANS